MAKGYRVTVDGLDELKKRLEKLSGDLRAKAEDALSESADAVKKDMMRRVPVDTGNLRRSITARVRKRQLTANVGPRPGKSAFYGYWVEFGTSSMRAQPFAGPAAEAERARWPNRLRTHLKDALPK